MALQNPYLSITFLVTIFMVNPSSASTSLSSNTSISFVGFNESRDSRYFSPAGASSIDGPALQLTPDTVNDESFLLNKSGRIMYYKPFTLWLSDIDQDDRDDVVASFTSSFVINIYRKDSWLAGEGFAFLIAPNTSIPLNSYGKFLGLTNATTDGNAGNKIVAVEFDTVKQGFDPDGNHIGLNVNSVSDPVKTVSLHEFEISPPAKNTTGINYTVWVDYDGVAKRIQIYMTKQGGSKPGRPLLNEPLNLREHVSSESYMGFAGSTGDPHIQLNCVLEWNLTVQNLGKKKDDTWLKIGVGVGVPATVLLACAVTYFGVVYMKERRRKEEEEAAVAGELKRLPDMARVFSYKELKRATNNFDDGMVLGQGGFGVVYRGVVGGDKDKDDSEDIAVKKFSRENIKGKDDFLAELTIIHRLRHKNLVRLQGWCYEKGKLFLVYDYMSNGSLDKHLYDTSNPNTLSWSHRYNILSGVASALHYLHNEYYQKVVHRDLKASNIMLDKDFTARLGDFGLARAIENERNSYTELGLVGAQGTLGYVAPECFHTGKATPESDVFGFGAVVLEVVCGRYPATKIQHQQNEYSLIDWVWMLHREGKIEEAVDERLCKDYDIDEVHRLLFLGLACCHPMASERPRTQDIFQIISKTMPAPHVPPFRPVFMWPSMGVNTYSTESGLSDMTLTSSQDYSGNRSTRMVHNGSARLLV